MKHLLFRTALLATLFTGSSAFADQALSLDPTSSDSVKTFALRWFERLQAGQIDRAQMRAELSENLTDEAVAEMSRHLEPYGPAIADEIVENRKIEDQTFYLVKLFLRRGDALTLLVGFDASGRITGVTFPSMGQE